MIFEHEIPSKSRLYFGESAKQKRAMENRCSEMLYEEGFEEIATPLFSYHQHQSFGDERQLIRLNDESNHEVTLRADSTIDTVRIVTKRLGRTTDHKKWFYIQPVVSYPTQEIHQVGAEYLDGRLHDVLGLNIKLLAEFDLQPLIQVSNIRIPKLLNTRYGISLETLKTMDVESLFETNYPWLRPLLELENLQDAPKVIEQLPQDLATELEKLCQSASKIAFDKMVLAPLYYAKMQYYEGLTYRIFENNTILARGGEYRDGNIEAAGFAINTDAVLQMKQNEK